MALTVKYLALTLWNRPIYGVLIAPFIACSRDVSSMVMALEVYEGTIIWVKTGRTKGVDHGYYKRVAPRPNWLRVYISDKCSRSDNSFPYRCCRYCTGCADIKHSG